MDNINIGVTPIIDNVVLNAGLNNQIIDITLIETAEVVNLDVSPNLIEINITRSEGEVQILQFASYSNFPATGKANYFYLAKDTNKLYRWTGTTYAELNALGYTAENVANKGIANGYAGLDSGGKVPSSQLPSYVDDVIEVANYAALPATGETGKIYITLDTNNIYRWSGSVYVEISTDKAVWGGITGTLANQTDLAAALAAKQDDLNGTGFVKVTGTTVYYDNNTYYLASNPDGYTTNLGTVTSVAMSVPSAFSVSGSPITTAGTLAVTATGTTSQYIAGDGSLVTFPVAGQAGTLVREIRNTTGATLTKGTIVYISGATGNKPTVSKAIATGDSTSAQTFGLIQTDLPNNSNGYVVCTGDIIGLDTSALTEGAQLYLSSTVAGTYTTTKQYAPAHLVYIGVVTRSHPTQGQIEVKIQNGYELEELHNVSAQTPSNNDGLFYESSSSLWKNKTIATVLGYTPANDANVVHKTGDESISGTKTFSTSVQANNLLFSESGGFIYIAGYSQIGGTADYFIIHNGLNTKSAKFTYSGATDFNMPASNGTLALTSDIPSLSGYVPTTRTISTTSPLAGGGSLASNLTLSIAKSTSTTDGYLSSTDWSTFNNKQSALTFSSPLVNTSGTISISKADTTTDGYLSSTDWNTFNGKQDALDDGTGFVKSTAGVITYDTNTYALDSAVVHKTGDETIADTKNFTGFAKFDNGIYLKHGTGLSAIAGYNLIDADTTSIYLSLANLASTAKIILSGLTQQRDFTLPDASGTFALTSDLHNPVTIGTANGLSLSTQVLSLGLASGSSNGALSSTDWTTFNGKQAALSGTGFIKISGSTISYDNSTYVPTSRTLTINGTALDLSIDRSWTIDPYTLPTASTTVLGGVKVDGSTITINGSGVISASGSTYTLPTATDTVLGGVKIGSGVTITSGVISVSTNYQAPLSGTGFVKISGSTISYDNSTYLTTSAASSTYLTQSSAASTYLPLTGGTLTGGLAINLGSGTGLNVASDNVVFRSNVGIGSPRQLVVSMGGGTLVQMEAKGYGANYITDFGIKTYNSSGTAFDVFYGTSAGLVGIGTTTPGAKLDVQTSSGTGSTTASGLARFVTATSSKAISIGQSDSARRLDLDSYSVLGNGEDLYVGTTSANALVSYVNSTERMRITTDGNILMGTSSTFNAGYINILANAATYNIMVIKNSYSGQGGNYMLFVGYSGTTTGYIAQTGTNTILYSAASDYRLKEDLKQINGLEKLSKINVYDFKWKDSNDRMDGVIAHELQSVLPYAVVGKKDEMNIDGSIKIQGVDYAKIVPVLVRAMQEEDEKVVILQKKVETLEAEIQILKNK